MSMRVLLRRPDPLLLAIAVWLLVWPAAHAIVTRALDVSPWRLGGWAMYATPAPRTSDVVVAVRECDAPRLTMAPADHRPVALVFEDEGGRRGGLAVDTRGRDLARGLAAFRTDGRVLAFDAWLRRAHHVDAEVSIVYAVVLPRLDLSRGLAFGHARVAVVTNGAIVQRGRMVASAAELETLLPDCGRA